MSFRRSTKIQNKNPIDPLDQYASFDIDILGSDDEEDAKDESVDDMRRKLMKKNRRGGEGDGDEKNAYMLFDFRRGPRRWPDNVEIIDHTEAMEMTEAALKEVEEAAASYAKMKEEQEDDNNANGKKGESNKKQEQDAKKATKNEAGPPNNNKNSGIMKKGSAATTIKSPKPVDPEDPDYSPAPKDAVFETLADGSTALIVQPGTRLMLNLEELLQGGDANKKKREREAAKKAANRLEYGGKTKNGEEGIGEILVEGGGGGDKYEKDEDAHFMNLGFGGGKAGDDDDDDFWGYSMWGGNKWGGGGGGGYGGYYSKWFKEYINAYTITMDVKFMNESLPREGTALFQSSLVYTEENPRTGQRKGKKSDGECLVSMNGGVGCFGTYGDTAKKRVEVNRWTRIVIAVKCSKDPKSEKGEMHTYVDTEVGAVIKEESIETDERFSIDPEQFFLFSSCNPNMMPGNIAIRTVRIENGFAKKADVLSNRARDKVISMFNEDRIREAALQRKGLSLAEVFAKPRPIWLAPSLIGTFGDSFVENTPLEGSSCLAWSATVLNMALQRALKHSVLVQGLDHATRSAASDVSFVFNQSMDVFRGMQKLLKHGNKSNLLAFLKKFRKLLHDVKVGESLLAPAIVEGKEILLLVERIKERVYNVTVIQTDPFGGLRYHSVSPSARPPEIAYRTCMVLSNIPKKNALDDVFWLALFNMAIQTTHGDTDRFYDILLPFLTNKPLESSLVEAETAAIDAVAGDKAARLYGSWRLPQQSSTAYVRCPLEALDHMLMGRGVTQFDANQMKLALMSEYISMIKNDLTMVQPCENGLRICDIAVAELSREVLSFAEECGRENTENLASSEGEISVSPVNEWLEYVQTLTSDVLESLDAIKDKEMDLPPQLDLSETARTGNGDAESGLKQADIIPYSSPNDNPDPALVQFRDSLAWEVNPNTPDPGQKVNLQKYVPIDMLQIPKCCLTRDGCVSALRHANRICDLLDDQSHCIKNNKLLIASLLEHLFTHVVPVPKPRNVNLKNSDLHRAKRSERRALQKQAKKEKRKKEVEAKRATKNGKKRAHGSVNENKEKEQESANKATTEIEVFGNEKLEPDFEGGLEFEAELNAEDCVWDQPITYELQVELMICLRRLCEHFAAAAFSIQQSRPWDAVCIVVPGVICAIGDSIMRKRAIDLPSEACTHLMGQTRDGKQLGHMGFGLSVGTFATQSETIEVHTPELAIARTKVLDYFLSPQQRPLAKMMTWENDYTLKPGRHLIKYIRTVAREVAMPAMEPHKALLDAQPMSSSLLKAYPEFHCFRDISFWWKYFLNPDRKVFPNSVSGDGNLHPIHRLSAQLHFQWEAQEGGFQVSAMDNDLRCRPDPKQLDPVTGKKLSPEEIPTHRFPSTATPSFYMPEPTVRTEDDILYRPNLPSFEDDNGPALNQRDSELLLSALTVPYQRLPLVLAFFSSDDRIHCLHSPALRGILDSVLFEPGQYLEASMSFVEPLMVPTLHPQLLAAGHGMLINELHRSPDTIIRGTLQLVTSALAVDTGTVVEEGESDFNKSTDIILYVARLGARIESYISFLIDYARNNHESLKNITMRDVHVTPQMLVKLEEGQKKLREVLQGRINELFEDYLNRLDTQTRSNPEDEKLINRNSRLSCDLHAHKLVLFRNVKVNEMTASAAKTLVSSFVFLTTRHTWNRFNRDKGKMVLPETELYELLQVQRRRIISWANNLRQGDLDQLMQTAMQVSSSVTGSLQSSAEVLDKANRWSKIRGERSVGRWAVGSTRTATTQAQTSGKVSKPSLLSHRERSVSSAVGSVMDADNLGVEIDMQIGQMTLRSKHLEALETRIANDHDVQELLGDATMQASLVDKAEHCRRYRLVGLNHEVEFWHTPHVECPPLGDQWERDYDPAELYPCEQWIVRLFEPVRKSFFDGPQPPAMQFLLPEHPLHADAEVAVLLGLHQALGGPMKLVYLFRRLRCAHVYECVSHGRQWYWTLHLTTDARYCLHEMQPSTENRPEPYPDWWLRGAGSPYPAGVNPFICNSLDSGESKSVLIYRDASHPDNFSGGRELLIPSRLMQGLIPEALLDGYFFWQNEAVAPKACLSKGAGSKKKFAAMYGYKRLIGYPTNSEDGEYVIVVEMIANPLVEATRLPGRSVRVTRHSKATFVTLFERKKRIAAEIEQLGLLAQKKKRGGSDQEGGDQEGSKTSSKNKSPGFKVGDQVECDYEGAGEMWPCEVVSVNANGTYDIEYTGAFHWVGIQRQVEDKLLATRDGRRNNGEGIWHFDSMSESEDDDWRSDTDSEKDSDENDGGTPRTKAKLSFSQFDDISIIMDAAGGDDDVLIGTLRRLAAVPGVEPFSEVNGLAKAVTEYVRDGNFSQSNASSTGEDSEAMLLLNLMYAPRRSRLHKVAKCLSRIENMSHILAWTKISHPTVSRALQSSSMPGGGDPWQQWGCPPISLVELPRLKLSFTERVDHAGEICLYSIDHNDLFISNKRSEMISCMLAGIPHSLLLSNMRGEEHLLVPAVSPNRPKVTSMPFSTFIVLNRSDEDWLEELSTKYFMYPVHVSTSFLLTKGLSSALYLMLLRFLHRDYDEVFRMADSIATDHALSPEELVIFNAFNYANDDWHPDAHACRLKISLCMLDSGEELPWDLTNEAARHIVKLGRISSNCRLSSEEELQLLESSDIVLDENHEKYEPTKHNLYSCTIVKNRLHALRSLLVAERAKNMLGSGSFDDAEESGHLEVNCWTPPRSLSTNWPYYQDNTMLGEKYASMVEVKEEGGEASWEAVLEGFDGISDPHPSENPEDAITPPPGGWVVVVLFHVIWSEESVRLRSKMDEMFPQYQNLATFATVNSERRKLIGITKDLNVSQFPSVLVFRGGKEMARFVGEDGVVQKLAMFLNSELTEYDRGAHAKKRHQRRLNTGGPDSALMYEENRENQKKQIVWTWDPEQRGGHFVVEQQGMTALMMQEEDDEEEAVWQYQESYWGEEKWKEFPPGVAKALERGYTRGKLWANRELSVEAERSFFMYINSVKVSDWEISGLDGYFNDGSCEDVQVRRLGSRNPVKGEEEFLSKKQIQRDKQLLEYKKELRDYQAKLREKQRGFDTESIRGTIGLKSGSGIQTWSLRWNHEPSRLGSGDGAGLAGEGCENFGPCEAPCLGGKYDGGGTVALHADGNVYHNGNIIASVPFGHIDRRKEAMEKKRKEPKPKSKKESGCLLPVPEVNPEQMAPLFGRGNVVTLTLDCDDRGGVLTFAIDGNDVVGLEVAGVFELLGDTEVFPAISLSPHDPAEHIEPAGTNDKDKEADQSESEGDQEESGGDKIEDEDDEEENEDDQEEHEDDREANEGDQKENEEDHESNQEEQQEEEEENIDLDDDALDRLEEETKALKRAMTPSVTLLQEGAEAFPPIGEADITADAQTTTQESDIYLGTPEQDEKRDTTDEDTEEKDSDEEEEDESRRLVVFCPNGHETVAVERDGFSCDVCNRRVHGEALFGCRECNWDSCVGCAKKSEEQRKTASDVPIDEVVWMVHLGNKWDCYAPDVSRQLEEAFRDGKRKLLLNVSGEELEFNLRGTSTTTVTYSDGSEPCTTRRHVKKNGLAGQWEMLSLMYNAPSASVLSGTAAIDILQKIWVGGETSTGSQSGLGFLFLYHLLSGSIRLKVVQSGWEGFGFPWGGASGDFFYGSGYGYGAYGGGQHTTKKSGSGSDAHRFAVLCAQLFEDRSSKSVLNSVANIMCRNPHVSLRMPKFKDTRKTKHSSTFNGWTDEIEPRSPLSELMESVLPVMLDLNRKGALHFPPMPPYAELPTPARSYNVSHVTGRKKGHENECAKSSVASAKAHRSAAQALGAAWARPKLTDCGCSNRPLRSVSPEQVLELASFCGYDLGADPRLRCAPPLSIEDESHFDTIMNEIAGQSMGPGLVCVDFFATWCGPCKALAPLYRMLSLRTPLVKFLKVDTDEVDKISERFKIQSLPTLMLFRGGAQPCHVLQTFVGGGSQFLEKFAEALCVHLTIDEKELMGMSIGRKERQEPHHCSSSDLTSAAKQIAVSDEQIKVLAERPLANLDPFIHFATRQYLGLPLVPSELPFDLSMHEAGSTAVAQSMLDRMRDDVKDFSHHANKESIPVINGLDGKNIDGYFSQQASQEQAELQNTKLREVRERVQQMLALIRKLRDDDIAMVTGAIPLILASSNHISLNATLKDDKMKERMERLRFILQRKGRLQSHIWIEFIFGSLLSTDGEADLLSLNPYLPKSRVHTIVDLVTAAMLRANRVGQANRCMGTIVSLLALLDKLIGLSMDQRCREKSTLLPKIVQTSNDLATAVIMGRHYVKSQASHDSSWADPRFLVFEFVWNILLRKKQIEIVNNFIAALNEDIPRSKVRQMIMGAGKTTVVAPLLALMLADGKSLVLSVVPKALVEMSRTRMRETFASIMVKRIYTLDFDRSTTVQASMRRSLENARSNRGVVVATPTAVKSIMLSYLERIGQYQEAQELGIHTKARKLAEEAVELQKILKILQDGVTLLDEVDLILHPLRSELNFPVGEKFDLDGSEQGERWSLPIHLFDALFFQSRGKTSVLSEQGGTAELDILRKIASAIQEGISARHMQRLPHLTLLNPQFYHDVLRPLMAEWVYIWLLRQHLHGIDKFDTLRYLLEGAAAKADITSRIELMEEEYLRLEVELGELDEAPMHTKAYERLIPVEEQSVDTLERLKLRRRHSETVMADPLLHAELHRKLRHLKETIDSTELQRKLLVTLNEIESRDDVASAEAGHQLGKIVNEIFQINKSIEELEFPRDDSFDNSIIVWVSSSFGKTDAGKSLNTSSSELGLSSVPQICARLEEQGFTIRRCQDADGAMALCKELRAIGYLRCIIVGGDDHGVGCGRGCVRDHRNDGNCLVCGEDSYSHYDGHTCRSGRRGSWITTTQRGDDGDDVDAIELMRSLTDPESSFSRQHGGHIEPSRTCVFTGSSGFDSDERMDLWRVGSLVAVSADEIVQFVQDQPSWPTNDQMESFAELDDHASSADSEMLVNKAKLEALRARLVQLESARAVHRDQEERQRTKKRDQMSSAFQELQECVISRKKIIEGAIRRVTKVLEWGAVDGAVQKNPTDKRRSQAKSGLQCAMSLSWIEHNLPRLESLDSIDEFRADEERLLRHLDSLAGEVFFLEQLLLAAKIMANVGSSAHKKMLNLCHNWLRTFLPHCLSKINRVSFGLLSSEDCQKALDDDPNVPRSRLKLAVPFVGKDVPSKSSEFAHPDVIIGMTVLAYRYSGLRRDDFVDIIDLITQQFSQEIGPPRDRNSSRRYDRWVIDAGGAIRQPKSVGSSARKDIVIATEELKVEVVQLKFLQKSDEEQMDKLFELFRYEPTVLHYYLQKVIFPTYMRSQNQKLSASGQALGGDMIVSRRVGFSGTPSDLLPKELGRCDYETGDDGRMLSTVLNRDITSYQYLPSNWDVNLILQTVASAENPRVSALIDTGALITGLSNFEVASELLRIGLGWCDGIVFLDDQDQQKVLVRATGRVVSADQCGIPLEKRFAFYDQIHTTGMDIKHVVNAVAVLTLGKDMTFRDYVQGAYRMRGIGVGQQISVLISPEVQELMSRELRHCHLAGSVERDVSSSTICSGKSCAVLASVAAWLTVNSMRSEQTQWAMLCLQNVANLYRKKAFRHVQGSLENLIQIPEDSDLGKKILSDVVEQEQGERIDETGTKSVDAQSCLDVFCEPVRFDLAAGVQDPVPFDSKLRTMIDDHSSFIDESQIRIGEDIISEVGQFMHLQHSAAGSGLETEQEREQEQEQEKEVQSRKEQHIEVEKFVEREYSRQEEAQKPWPFQMLAETVEGRNPKTSRGEHPFYPLRDFKLRHHDSMEFPQCLYLSGNFFNPKWSGLRRVKNVVMVLEYAPSTEPCSLRIMDPEENASLHPLDEAKEGVIRKAYKLLGLETSDSKLMRESLARAVEVVTDRRSCTEELDNLIRLFGKGSSDTHSALPFEAFRDMLLHGVLEPQQKGRYWVAVSLAEAETIRRILHVRSLVAERSQRNSLCTGQSTSAALIHGHSTELALRFSPMCAPGAPTAGDGGVVLDCSKNWANGTGVSAFQASLAHCCLRFFDGDMHFSEPAINILVRALHSSSVHLRERFFLSNVGCRRRMERKWQETPLARVFTMSHHWLSMKDGALASFVRRVLKMRKMTLWDAFKAFDSNNNGMLAPAELYGAFNWLGVPTLSAEDVADFLESADRNYDGVVDYDEYMKALMDPIMRRERVAAEAAGEIVSVGVHDDGEIGAFGTEDARTENGEEADMHHFKVEPFGAEEIREVLLKRRQLHAMKQREERIKRQANAEILDASIFEDELKESQTRKGGANPAIYESDLRLKPPFKPLVCVSKNKNTDEKEGEENSNGIESESDKFETKKDGESPGKDERDNKFALQNPQNGHLFTAPPTISMATIDFGFVTNQKPLRMTFAGGKASFLPIGLDTVSYKKEPAICCNSRHRLEKYDSYWSSCSQCERSRRHVSWACHNCSFYLCGRCYDSHVRKVIDQREDPSKNPTFLRCHNACSFTLQVPSIDLVASSIRKSSPDQTESGDRGERIGMSTRTQYTMVMDVRFPKLPPKANRSVQSILSFKVHESNRKPKFASIFLDSDGRILLEGSNVLEEESESATPTDNLASAHVFRHRPAVVRAGLWCTIAISVDGEAGRAMTFVDGMPCAEVSGCEVSELRLHHKILIFGGGKQAASRGGDIRRLRLYESSLDTTGVFAAHSLMLNDSHSVSADAATLIQRCLRGFFTRSKFAEAKAEIEKERQAHKQHKKAKKKARAEAMGEEYTSSSDEDDSSLYDSDSDSSGGDY